MNLLSQVFNLIKVGDKIPHQWMSTRLVHTSPIETNEISGLTTSGILIADSPRRLITPGCTM